MKALAWATALLGVGLGFFSACAREPGTPLFETRGPVNLDDILSGQCVRNCEPDYGSEPVDCAAAESPYEFFPEPIWDFETQDMTPRLIPNPETMQLEPHPLSLTIASRLYSYQDKSTGFLRTSTCLLDASDCDPNEYEPSTYPTDRCAPEGSPPGTVTGHALHVRGGPFREWGGGIGRRLQDLTANAMQRLLGGGNCLPQGVPAEGACEAATGGRPLIPENCDSFPPVTQQAEGVPSFCPEPDTCMDCAPGGLRSDGSRVSPKLIDYYGSLVDLREWEGISFWARGGPDGQRTIRIAIGDRNTDEDVSFMATNAGIEPRCRRKRECACRDQERSCNPDPASPSEFWCWNPATDPAPSDIPRLGLSLEPEEVYEPCGNWACDFPFPAWPDAADADLAFVTPNHQRYPGTTTCNPYTYPNEQSSSYCYDLNGLPPASGLDECGDPWSMPVLLNPDWTFYAIPFSDLHQDGYGKEFPNLELKAISMVRFLWSQGWYDFWIDDVRFYRRKR